ncbi:ABC transporter ATP-binding protein [candidate division KSB1 bacterium]
MKPSVELINIRKNFGKIAANNEVNFTLLPGEIHSLVGGNGAGKSTLAKILFGILKPDSGDIRLNGKTVTFNHPRDSRSFGIGMVPQEMFLVETFSVFQNIILGIEKTRFGFIEKEKLREKISSVINKYDLGIDPDEKISQLTVGERQKILITRLLFQEAKIIILDEPTAALTPKETESLFGILDKLKSSGVPVLFISHKLPEIIRYSDRISIMRTGKIVETLTKGNYEIDKIITLMTGEKLPPVLSNKPKTEDQTEDIYDNSLEIYNISYQSDNRKIENISINVAPGEIFGILGVEGNGQNELESLLSGKISSYDGYIAADRKKLVKGKPSELKKHSIAYIPSSRETNGLIPEFSISDNVILGWHKEKFSKNTCFLDNKKNDDFSENLIDKFLVKTENKDKIARFLSGGNQQKIVLGRELSFDPKILLACNPSRGIDIKTTFYIHNLFFNLADTGCAILVMLSDIEEALVLCHRIGVLYNGRIIKVIRPEDTTDIELGLYMTGGI